MKYWHWAIGTALALTSVLALAQQGPESLLPPGFDQPAPRSGPRPVPRAAPAAAPSRAPVSEPRITAQPLADVAGGASKAAAGANAGAGRDAGLAALPSVQKMLTLPQDQLDILLGLRPKSDIPPGAQRALSRVGLLDAGEGGLPPISLAHQDASLVKAALAGNSGLMVSRWGHILLRRALASRLDAPDGMDPADFIALRAALLARMGEGNAARVLVQDVDPDSYNPALTQAALDADVATADFTGFCPVLDAQPGARKDSQWQVFKAICAAFSGNGAAGFAQLDHLTYVGAMPRIDMLLAQKYAGAAGKARRAVTIEWNGISDMIAWRYGLTIATGLTPPASAMGGAGPRFAYTAALAPMLGLGARADASERAAAAGILSSAAMVDLYSQIYAEDDVKGDAADRALLLRDAYVGETPETKLKAMQQLWDGAGDAQARYSRQVLTAYAAARLPADAGLTKNAGDIIASMLAAGLDANALRWSKLLDQGSAGWAQLALADANARGSIGSGELGSFASGDGSENKRRSAFLLAGLAGLGRVSDTTKRDFAGKLSISLDGRTRWTSAIDSAAAVGNPTLVALLAGLGMQGDDWKRMTPRYLYHIVAALNRVGLSAEARMIAAEAVARG